MSSSNAFEDWKLDQLMSMSVIDKIRHKKITVQFRDAQGDIVSASEVMTKIIELVYEKVHDPNVNSITQKIFPLMASSVSGGLAKFDNMNQALLLLSDVKTTEALISLMITGFVTARFLEQHSLKIEATEEDITPEEIERMNRMSLISSLGLRALSAGVGIDQIIKFLLDGGYASTDELKQLGFSDENIEKAQENTADSSLDLSKISKTFN